MVHRLDKEKIQQILDSYDSCGRKIREAARITGHTESTIAKYWKENGLEPVKGVMGGKRVSLKGRRGAYTPEEEARIVGAYNEYGGNLSKAVRELHFYAEGISKVWKRNGLEIKKNTKRIPEEDERKIIEAYNLYGRNSGEVSRRLGYSPSIVLRVWKKQGLVPGRGRANSLEEDIFKED